MLPLFFFECLGPFTTQPFRFIPEDPPKNICLILGLIRMHPSQKRLPTQTSSAPYASRPLVQSPGSHTQKVASNTETLSRMILPCWIYRSSYTIITVKSKLCAGYKRGLYHGTIYSLMWHQWWNEDCEIETLLPFIHIVLK